MHTSGDDPSRDAQRHLTNKHTRCRKRGEEASNERRERRVSAVGCITMSACSSRLPNALWQMRVRIDITSAFWPRERCRDFDWPDNMANETWRESGNAGLRNKLETVIPARSRVVAG